MELQDIVNPNSKLHKCIPDTNNYNDDPVNHPNHYTQGGIECIDAIEASMSHEAFSGYLKGNIIKYIWRYQHKNNPIEDLQKAKWYQSKLIKHESRRDNE